MSDETELNSTEPTVPEGTPVVAATKAPSGDFLSSKAGKAMLIGGAAAVLIIIAAVVGWFVLGPASVGQTGTPGTPTAIVPITPAPTPSAPVTSSAVATLPVADITSRDVFTPRNPFTVISAASIPAASTSDGTTSTATATNTSTTLYLTDVVTVSGVRKAVVKYRGVKYTVGAGETVTGSSWKIITINSSSIEAQYGSSADLITISVSATK